MTTKRVEVPDGYIETYENENGDRVIAVKDVTYGEDVQIPLTASEVADFVESIRTRHIGSMSTISGSVDTYLDIYGNQAIGLYDGESDGNASLVFDAEQISEIAAMMEGV